MTTYSNPRTEATVYDWPLGRDRRDTAMFAVESDPKRGERAVRITLNPAREAWSAPRKLTYARRVRIVDGDDGRIYIAALTEYGFVSIMKGTMDYQHEVVHEGDPRLPELLALFEDSP